MSKKIDKAKGSVKDFFSNFISVLRRPDMIILPGNLAFFFVLAIIPTLALISYGASILNLSTDFLYDFLAKSFSIELADLILGVHLNANMGIGFIITIIVGLYIASNGADSIITVSNTIYGIKNKSWLRRRIKAIGMSLIIVVLLTFMLIVPVFGNTIMDLIKDVNLNPSITNKIEAIFEFLKGPISWLIMFLLIKIIYTIAPDKKSGTRVINYGVLFTSVCWILVTKLFSLYVNNYVSYTVLYGGLANIVVLMIWIYFLCLVFTVGIALNSEKEEKNLLKNGTINN